MAKMTPSQWRQFASQWHRAGKALDGVHREELANWRYDARVVDALLDIGAKAPRKEEEPNGLVEMQKWFMKIARKQGLLPAVREEAASYAAAGKGLFFHNNVPLPTGPKLALLCSVKCPGKLILDTYDFCQRLRDIGVTVVSGFHSPMEQECLRILLRSPHGVIWCLARGLLRKIPTEPVDCLAAVAEGRLVLASPFPASMSRITARSAVIRNRLVVDLAGVVVVTHAAPGSKVETLCRELLAAGKLLYTFEHPANAALLRAGARVVAPDIDWQKVIQGVVSQPPLRSGAASGSGRRGKPRRSEAVWTYDAMYSLG